MRLAGQGLSSHTATTTISRFFEKNVKINPNTITFKLKLLNIEKNYYIRCKF